MKLRLLALGLMMSLMMSPMMSLKDQDQVDTRAEDQDQDQDQVDTRAEDQDQDQDQVDTRAEDQDQDQVDTRAEDQDQDQADTRAEDQDQADTRAEDQDQDQVDTRAEDQDQDQVDTRAEDQDQDQVDTRAEDQDQDQDQVDTRAEDQDQDQDQADTRAEDQDQDQDQDQVDTRAEDQDQDQDQVDTRAEDQDQDQDQVDTRAEDQDQDQDQADTRAEDQEDQVDTRAEAGTDLDLKTNSTEAPDETIVKAHKTIKSRRRRNAVSCWMCKWPKYGSYVEIPIHFDPIYSHSDRKMILDAVKPIEAQTCIRFYEISYSLSFFRRHLYFFSGSGCWSYVGRKWWLITQKVSLAKEGCLATRTIQHEVLHALGFVHEQSRSDRDDHVIVHYGNIEPDKKYNFNKEETNNLDTPYDLSSVMQYRSLAWARNNQRTLVSKKNPSESIQYASGVSKYDILRVNRLYRCGT